MWFPAPDLVLEWFRCCHCKNLVSEGAKHLFLLCEKRHFAPVQNRFRLLRTVRLQYIRQYDNLFLRSIFYLIKLSRERAAEYHATLLLETWWPWRPSLLSKFMPKHDEEGGDIGEKQICGQLRLVRVDLTQRPINRACCSMAYRIIVNKIKEQFVSRKKIHCRVA